MELISGEAASVDAPSLDMEGWELQLPAFVLSTRDVSAVAADRRLTKFPALDLSAAVLPDRSGRSHPKGAACTTPPGGPGGAGSDTPTVCTSNTTAAIDVGGGSRMLPGSACTTCHSRQGGPRSTIAGTVYATAHEPNDCHGVNGGLTVVVTDANGVVTNIAVNSVGNFESRARIAAPFRVKVTDGVRERVMAGTLTAGDCNSCHTRGGFNGAPGRVMAP